MTAAAIWNLYRWAAVILAPVFLCFWLGAMVTNAGLKGKLASANQKLATAERSLATCQDNRRELEAGIARQRAVIEANKVERARIARQGARDTAAARGVAESYRQRAERVLRARAGEDQCESADRLILESLR